MSVNKFPTVSDYCRVYCMWWPTPLAPPPSQGPSKHRHPAMQFNLNSIQYLFLVFPQATTMHLSNSTVKNQIKHYNRCYILLRLNSLYLLRSDDSSWPYYIWDHPVTNIDSVVLSRPLCGPQFSFSALMYTFTHTHTVIDWIEKQNSFTNSKTPKTSIYDFFFFFRDVR